jgi:hypothetical protein
VAFIPWHLDVAIGRKQSECPMNPKEHCIDATLWYGSKEALMDKQGSALFTHFQQGFSFLVPF